MLPLREREAAERIASFEARWLIRRLGARHNCKHTRPCFRPVWTSIKAVGRRIWGRLCEFPVAVKALSQVMFVVAVLLVVVAGATSERAINTLGAFLQLGGFLTVAVGIEKTLQSFGREAFWERLKEPFEDFWSIFTGRHIVVEVSDEVQVSASASASVNETVSYSHDLSLNERIDLVKEEVERLESKLEDLDDRIDEEAERLEEKFEEEISELREKMRQLREMVETANIGSITLRLEWLGVYLLIFGLLLSTFPSTAYALGNRIGTGLLSIFGI
jgi:hypothetical protein